jgi:hypothetical protein
MVKKGDASQARPLLFVPTGVIGTIMTTTVKSAPSEAVNKVAAKPSPHKKRRASATVKTVRRSPKKKAGNKKTSRPATLDDARREMLRLVCRDSAAMTKAIIDDALQGKYLSARFLFEAVGLCAVKGEEVEDIADRETLAGLLLHKWQVAPQATAEGAEVTEVPQVTVGMAMETQAPVES